MLKKPHASSYIGLMAITLVAVLILSGCSTGSTLPVQTKEPTQAQTQKITEAATKQAVTQPRTTEAPTQKPTETETEPETDPIVGSKTSFKDMGLGDICKVDEYYVGLQYVKKMAYLPTALGKEEVSPDSEVILGFFEFFNGSWEEIKVNPGDITCYADGTQVGDVETYIKVEADGVKQFSYATLDSGYRLITCQDFDVPKDWKELKFFYSSNCIWTIRNDDVSEKDYTPDIMMYSIQKRDLTAVDDVIYSKEYEIQFKGHQLYYDEDAWFTSDYVVFKFRVTNKSSQELNTGLMGYDMRAYQDGTLLGDATYTLNDKVDGYINIFDVDSVAPGMSSNIYVAFEAKKKDSVWMMVYDDGYITPHYCGSVYVADLDEEPEESEAETSKEGGKEKPNEATLTALLNKTWESDLSQARIAFNKDGTMTIDALNGTWANIDNEITLFYNNKKGGAVEYVLDYVEENGGEYLLSHKEGMIDGEPYEFPVAHYYPTEWTIETTTEDKTKPAEQRSADEQIAALKNVAVGDVVRLGFYEQDNNRNNGDEEIEWVVLDAADGKALIISKDILVKRKLNPSAQDTTWEKSSLRKWLNQTFYDAAFTPEIQKIIMETSVKAEKNPSYDTPEGGDTTDKVFILSLAEATRYFKFNESRTCNTTTMTKGARSWWLRTPGQDARHMVSIVSSTGDIEEQGSRARDENVGVRPVMWISIDK